MNASLQVTAQDALIAVDLQNDFCPGGKLAVTEGDLVVGLLDRLLPRFAVTVATRDWHPADHCSFVDHGGDWPAHCVIGTPGADYHPTLRLDLIQLHIRKAMTPDRDTFNGFDGQPPLGQELRRRGVERVFIGGLATEYCVQHTVLGALAEGFETYVLTDGIRAVELQPGDGQRACDTMRQAGAKLIESALLVGP